jgi:hypothetical protein
MKIQYILVRTDLPSLQTEKGGKGMAHSAHAGNAMVHHIVTSGDPLLIQALADWGAETGQGFGTCVTLGATGDQINAIMEQIRRECVELHEKGEISMAGTSVDPTYPYVVDSEVVKLIDKRFHSAEPKKLDDGTYLCHRSEMTAAFLFGEKDEIGHLVSHLKRHP